MGLEMRNQKSVDSPPREAMEIRAFLLPFHQKEEQNCSACWFQGRERREAAKPTSV